MDNLDASWITNLREMKCKHDDDIKMQMMREYVRIQSHDSLSFNPHKYHFEQLKPLPWSYIFDLIKNSASMKDFFYNITFTVLHEWPQDFKPSRPDPDPGKMYATYNPGKDAISVMVLTGNCIEHRGDEDGFGEEKDEHEALIGLLNRQGKWIDGPAISWV